MLPGLTAGLV